MSQNQNVEEFMRIMAKNNAFIKKINMEYEILLKKILIGIINEHKQNPYFLLYLQTDYVFFKYCQKFLKEDFNNFFPNIENLYQQQPAQNTKFFNYLDFIDKNKNFSNLFNALKNENHINNNEYDKLKKLNETLNLNLLFKKTQFNSNIENNNTLKISKK